MELWDETVGAFSGIMQGYPVMLFLVISAVPVALVLGIIGGVLSSTGSRILRGIVLLYVYLFRSTPFLMLIFLAYYGLPYYGIDTGALPTAIIALAVCHGAYMTEIVRGGLAGLDKGQIEAATALGFSPLQRLRDIVLPQALMSVVPSLLGQIILLIKDTSLVSIIGISELTKLGKEVMIRTNGPFVVFTIVALAYFVLCFALETVSRGLESWIHRRTG